MDGSPIRRAIRRRCPLFGETTRLDYQPLMSVRARTPYNPMFTNFHYKEALVVLTAAGALLWTACSDDNTNVPPDGPQAKTPRVELAEGTATATTLSFTATSSDAERCAYVCIPADAVKPSAAEILQGGGRFRQA